MSNFLKNNPLMLAGESRRAGSAEPLRKAAVPVAPASPRGVVTPSGVKLPHERDESAESTGAVQSEAMQQAYRDLRRGLPDTDRGAEAGHTYRKLKR